jgi:hypothetical protein
MPVKFWCYLLDRWRILELSGHARFRDQPKPCTSEKLEVFAVWIPFKKAAEELEEMVTK